jgi:glycosyltransferase involved in cell wall biosynthesis
MGFGSVKGRVASVDMAVQGAECRLSICIPTYNMAAWVGSAVASALAVGFPDEVEVVVLDNCSTDETGRVLAEFAGAPNLRVVVADEHLDMVANFNRAAMSSCGAWLTMLSADDELAPSYYRNIRDHLSRVDTAALSQVAMIGDRAFGSVVPHNFDVLELAESLGSCVCLATTAFRRDLYERVGGFDAEVGMIFDFDFFVRLSLVSGLPVRGLGVVGGSYFPARGATWTTLDATGGGSETCLRWIALRKRDLGPEVARAAERSIGRRARERGYSRLSRGESALAARRELIVAFRCTAGRERWTTSVALLVTWLPGGLPSASFRWAARIKDFVARRMR